MTFSMPIYSSIIGVLMPEKKFIPMSLLPLDCEFTLNPYALYSSLVTGNRNYTINKFEIYTHVIFFE